MSVDTSDKDAVQFTRFKLREILDRIDKGEFPEKAREYGGTGSAQMQWSRDEEQARPAIDAATIPPIEDETHA